MKQKMFYCSWCEKKTIHHIEDNNPKYTGKVDRVQFLKLECPSKVCNECGKETKYEEVIELN